MTDNLTNRRLRAGKLPPDLLASFLDDLGTPDKRVLLGPGPSNLHPRVVQAMTSPTLGILDPDFLAIMDHTMVLLRHLFQTENELSISLPGTGMSGMEAAVCNVVEPGDEVVVKIQRPRARAQVTTDLDILERLARTAEARTDWARDYGAVALAAEFSRALSDELDHGEQRQRHLRGQYHTELGKQPRHDFGGAFRRRFVH